MPRCSSYSPSRKGVKQHDVAWKSVGDRRCMSRGWHEKSCGGGERSTAQCSTVLYCAVQYCPTVKDGPLESSVPFFVFMLSARGRRWGGASGTTAGISHVARSRSQSRHLGGFRRLCVITYRGSWWGTSSKLPSVW